MRDGIAESLWDTYGELTLDDLPPHIVKLAQQCILDWFGCVIAGSREVPATMIRDLLGSPDGAATLLGTVSRGGDQTAAIVNGTTGHAMDYDDSNFTCGIHGTGVVLPAALAAAEVEGRSGTDLLVALVVGIEIASRLGIAIGQDHYNRGWHISSSIGIFGAAAAASWLFGFDQEQFGHAVGLAASQSSGVQANFGTMTKPFHSGHAAERGLLAAKLARVGFTSNPRAFDATRGLAEAASTGQLDLAAVEALDGAWALEQTRFKRHAACHGTQATIEATLALCDQVDAAAVDAVRVTVHSTVTRVCKVVLPTSGLEAKFSLRAATALAMLGDDTTSPATFNDDRVRDRDLRDLLERIDVVTDDSISRHASSVRFETDAGSVDAFYDSGAPIADPELLHRRLIAKFTALTEPVIGGRSATLRDLLLDVTAVDDVTQLTGLTRPE